MQEPSYANTNVLKEPSEEPRLARERDKKRWEEEMSDASCDFESTRCIDNLENLIIVQTMIFCSSLQFPFL